LHEILTKNYQYPPRKIFDITKVPSHFIKESESEKAMGKSAESLYEKPHNSQNNKEISRISSQEKKPRIYFGTEANYNKRLKKRILNQLTRKFTFCAILKSCFPSQFILTTKSDCISFISKNARVSCEKQNSVFVDLTIDETEDRLEIKRQYRTMCKIKGLNQLSNVTDLIFYNFETSNIPPPLKPGQIAYIYVNGASTQFSHNNGMARISVNDKADWAILDINKKVMFHHPDFATNLFERSFIYDSLNLLQNDFKRLFENTNKFPLPPLLDKKQTENDKEYYYMLDNLKIQFPYKPYEIQIKYSQYVIKAIGEHKNALLESPTGSGKTMTLLCSVLSWLHSANDKHKNRLVYLSRTYEQLRQISSELQKIKHDVVSVIMGSRQKLCLIDAVKNENSNPQQACELARSSNLCTKIITKTPWLKKRNVEIEDFFCESGSPVCPYFAMRGVAEYSDVVLMPYSYIIDPFVSRSLENIDLHNSIIVFDEAQNLRTEAENALFIKLDYTELCKFIFLVDGNIKKSIISLCNFIKGFDKFKNKNAVEIIGKLTDIITLGNANFDEYMRSEFKIINQVDKKVESGFALRWSRIVFQLFYISQLSDNDKTDFFVNYIYKPECIRLEIKCYDASLVLKRIQAQKPQTIILTSGTLSPFDLVEKELKIDFPVKLINKHIIKQENIFLRIFGENSYPYKFNFSYSKRDLFQYLKLCDLLYEICEIVPGGILCFFSSYQIIDDFILQTKSNCLWCKIKKSVFIELKTGIVRLVLPKFIYEESSIQEYKAFCQQSSGALFLAICRGKISEGINFCSQESLSVIVVGIPFAPFDENRKQVYKNRSFSYEDWYRKDAITAVNQSIGRAFRHENDFGSVILLDERYENKEIINLLPSWIESRKTVDNISCFLKDLKKFYESTIYSHQRIRMPKESNYEVNNVATECKTYQELEHFSDWKAKYYKTLYRRKIRKCQVQVKMEPKDD